MKVRQSSQAITSTVVCEQSVPATAATSRPSLQILHPQRCLDFALPSNGVGFHRANGCSSRSASQSRMTGVGQPCDSTESETLASQYPEYPVNPFGCTAQVC